MNIYYVYALQSSEDRRIYVGMTSDLHRRIKEHNDCRVRSTKAFSPWVLIIYKEVNARIEARKFEKYYKSGVEKEYLKSLDTANGPVVQRIE